MKKNKIVGALALMMLGASPAFAAENSNTNFESTAQIENTCLIEADDVNFGQVYAPLTTQGTKSEMRVLCSKNTSYTIDLAYGGVYGEGTQKSEYSIAYTTSDSNVNHYRIYDSSGAILGSLSCGFDGYVSTYANRVQFQTDAVAKIYGAEKAGWYDNNGICYTSETNKKNEVYPIGLEDGYTGGGKRQSIGKAAYAYGMMIGASKGDNLAYKITVPGDITKVWNSGNNSYKATASGEFEKIEMNAQIVPENSSKLYLAQDSYFDTVTAIISY